MDLYDVGPISLAPVWLAGWRRHFCRRRYGLPWALWLGLFWLVRHGRLGFGGTLTAVAAMDTHRSLLSALLCSARLLSDFCSLRVELLSALFISLSFDSSNQVFSRLEYTKPNAIASSAFECGGHGVRRVSY